MMSIFDGMWNVWIFLLSEMCGNGVSVVIGII